MLKVPVCSTENYAIKGNIIPFSHKKSAFLYSFILFPKDANTNQDLHEMKRRTYFFRKAARATVNFCWSTSFTETGGILL